MAASLTAPKILTITNKLTGTQAQIEKTTRILVGVATTNDVVVDAQATYQLLSVPAGTVIKNVRTRIITAFTTSVTMTIGDGNAAAGFLASAKIAPTSAETAGKYTSTTLATADAYAGGLKYLVADTVDLVVGGATPVAGLMEVLIDYVDGLSGIT